MRPAGETEGAKIMNTIHRRRARLAAAGCAALTA